MRRILWLGVLILAGCQNLRGPLQPKGPQRVDDPRLPIEEQQRRGRERYALPDDSRTAGPASGITLPGVHGR